MYPPSAEPEVHNSAVGWHWNKQNKYIFVSHGRFDLLWNVLITVNEGVVLLMFFRDLPAVEELCCRQLPGDGVFRRCSSRT